MSIRKTENIMRKTRRGMQILPPLKSYASAIILLLIAAGSADAGEDQVRKAMKESLVYLEIASYGYDQVRPWRNTDILQKAGVGCAVGKNKVITPAWNLTNSTLIKGRVFGQNEFINAKVRIIDYEVDLALIELDANSLRKPLKPLKFTDKFKRGQKLNYFWLDSAGNLTTGQGYLDRAEVRNSPVSYANFLNFIVTNTSQETGIGQLYCIDSTPVGIACWNDGTREAGLIPAAVINNFLSRAREANYPGVPTIGFAAEQLLDPAARRFLRMPDTLQSGVLITSVYTLGTGSDLLKSGDVILQIDGKVIDGHGKFEHPAYDRISFHHLITSHKIGDDISFEVWREATRQKISVRTKNFDVREMLVPFYEYGQQPEYLVMGGFIFQKLTLPYMANFGKDWDGKVSPHLLHYFRDLAFNPTGKRRDIVILSYVLPSPINLGYIDLSQQVVSKINDIPITCMADVIKAQKSGPESKFDIVEFELDNPTVVIPRDQLPQADAIIGRNYGIRKMVNIASGTD